MEYCERIIVEKEDPGIAAIHLVRYHFARPFCQGKRVLDCACGTGYGTARLHGAARRIIGIDLNREALDYAARHYYFSNVNFLVMDAMRLGFSSQSFEAICSFETLEHLRNPEAYLKEILRVLHPDGLCLISTPNARLTTSRPKNLHHFQEWNYTDFQKYLQHFFNSVEIQGVIRKQSSSHRIVHHLDLFNLKRLLPKKWRSKISRGLGTTAFHEMELERDIQVGPYHPEALSMVALCRSPKKEFQ